MSKTTINDVAKLAGVSPSAVSIYLNNRPGIAAKTEARIAEAIEQLGYVPRGNGNRNKSNGFVGLIVEQLPSTLTGDLFYSDIATGIQQEAEQLGYSVAITVVNEPPQSLPRLIDEDAVVGLLAIGGGDITDDFLKLLSESDTPFVTVDNESLSHPFNNIVVDNYRGAYLAVQHLIKLGHQRIAIIRGPEKYKSLTERYYGYLHAMTDAGLPIDHDLIQQPLSKGKPNKGYLEMMALLDLPEPPTAIFAVTDRTALGAMAALNEVGINVPDDLSIVGFDDVTPEAYPKPSLTSITSKRLDMGRIAMQRLHELINDPDQTPIKIVMHTQLVIRDTSAPPKPAS